MRHGRIMARRVPDVIERVTSHGAFVASRLTIPDCNGGAAITQRQTTRWDAVILDRDGVINYDSADYILTPEQWIPVPGALEAIARLHRMGIPVAVASNQSAVGRGMIDRAQFGRIRSRMEQAVAEAGGRIAASAYCFHGPDDGCDCRKPRPGLVEQVLARLGTPPARTIMIGDSLRDIEAARAAGVAAALVISGHHEAEPLIARVHALDPAIPVFPDLATAIDRLFPPC